MTLVVNGLTKRFAGLAAVNGLSFRAEAGNVTALIGPNGAGKTTALSMISGLMKPTSGSIELEGRRIDGKAAHQVASQGVARTYQNLQMFEDMTVLEVVMTGAHRTGESGVLSAMLRLPGIRRDERRIDLRARQALERVGMPSQLWGRDALSLPYGAQRRVELARALVSDPRFLLLDEPAAGLNPTETVELVGLIAELRREGIGLLLVEHDMEMVMSISDRVVVMNYGSLVASGSPSEVQRDPQVIEAYLGAEE